MKTKQICEALCALKVAAQGVCDALEKEDTDKEPKSNPTPISESSLYAFLKASKSKPDEPDNRKYEFTDEQLVLEYGRTVHRIRALRDFSDVKAGDLGGWIEKEANLSHEGNCWVYNNAKVFEDARVLGDAKVYDNARVYNQANVFNKARVFGNAHVLDSANVFDNAEVFGEARVYLKVSIFGDTKVFNGFIA